ncbi:MAG: hypothetical protein ACM3O7_06385 [Acidobacteriota bacterium]
MSVVLRVVAVLLLAGGVVAEVSGVVSAPGVALILGLCLATYTWFLATARCAPRPPQGRTR